MTQQTPTAAPRARYRGLSMLSIDQVAAVIQACRKSGTERRRVLWRNNLIVFELAVCAGLRVTEMQALKMQDIILDESAPRIELADRTVPLNWTPWLLPDLQEYIDRRAEDDIHERSPLLVSLRTKNPDGGNCYGHVPTKCQIYRWYLAACMKPTRRKLNPVLIQDRQALPGVGRESFIAAAIAAGIPPLTVNAAAGISCDWIRDHGLAAVPFMVTDPSFAGVVFKPTTTVQG